MSIPQEKGEFRSATINEPIWGSGNRNFYEVVKCSQGKVKEVRTGMGLRVSEVEVVRRVAGLREGQ